MADDKSTKMRYRCPYCFGLANDVYLHKDEDEYYCLRCSFKGSLEKINKLYLEFKSRYTQIENRVTLEQQKKM